MSEANSDRIHVLADRPDGLGERVRTIVNSAYLAKLMGVDYRFVWNRALTGAPDHSIYLAAEMFDGDYLSTHVLKDVVRQEYRELDGVYPTRESIRDAVGELRGMRVHQYDLHRHLAPDLHLPKGSYLEAFQSIKWAPSLQEAVNAGRNGVPHSSRCAAVHVRAGDIVYGRYRFSDSYAGKAVPVPLAKALVKKLRDKFDSVLLFTQDQDVNAYICGGDHKVVLASDLSSRINGRAEKALFEIALMSTCEEIYAGSSGFAQLAALISDQKTRSVDSLMSSEEQISALVGAQTSRQYRNCPELQQAFSSYALFSRCMNKGWFDFAKVALLKAIELDPANPFYYIRLHTVTFTQGDQESASEILREFLDKFDLGAPLDDPRWTAVKVLLDKTPNGAFRLKTDIEALRTAMMKGSSSARKIVEEILPENEGARQFVP